MRLLWLSLFVVAGCGEPFFAPPAIPSHTNSIGDRLHAARYQTPFLCGDEPNASALQGFSCTPALSAEVENWSCDASGCHGVYAFTDQGFGAKRTLRGGEGPSCYSCHGMVWDDIK